MKIEATITREMWNSSDRVRPCSCVVHNAWKTKINDFMATTHDETMIYFKEEDYYTPSPRHKGIIKHYHLADLISSFDGKAPFEEAPGYNPDTDTIEIQGDLVWNNLF